MSPSRLGWTPNLGYSWSGRPTHSSLRDGTKRHLRSEKGRHAGCDGKGIFVQGQIDELMRTRHQGRAHFNEWHAAIHYYRKGYQVLIEKYWREPYGLERTEYALQQNEGLWPFLRDCRGQPPDLLLYRRRQGCLEAIFVETKGIRRWGRERFTARPKVLFPFIVKQWGIPFKIAWVVA